MLEGKEYTSFVNLPGTQRVGITANSSGPAVNVVTRVPSAADTSVYILPILHNRQGLCIRHGKCTWESSKFDAVGLAKRDVVLVASKVSTSRYSARDGHCSDMALGRIAPVVQF
jgi:hypothetical protein